MIKLVKLIIIFLLSISAHATQVSDERSQDNVQNELNNEFNQSSFQRDYKDQNKKTLNSILPTKLLPHFKDKLVKNKYAKALKAGQWQLLYNLSTYLLTKSAFNLKKSLVLLKSCAKRGGFDAKQRYEKLKFLYQKKFLKVSSSEELMGLLKNESSPYALLAEVQIKLILNKFRENNSNLTYSLDSIEDSALALVKALPKNHHVYELLGKVLYQNQKKTKSLTAYQKAAKLGNAEGFNEIALAYKLGGLLGENKNKQVENFRKCASLGNPRCFNSMGYRYSNGFFGKKNKVKALEYYQQAAKRGWATSYRNISLIYNDEGFKNAELHHEYALHAAILGDHTAYGILARIYRHGRGVKVNNDIAFSWASAARNTTNGYSLFELAYCYDKGLGTLRDDHKAFKYYERATINNNYSAASNLASFYQYGRGTQKDCKVALKLHAIAAKEGKLYSASKLYQIYRGKCDKSLANEEKKMYWAKVGAEANYKVMPYSYAWELAYGSKTYRDYKLSKEWYLRSIESGIIEAAYGMGSFYYKGLGIKKDYKVAYAWYRLATHNKRKNQKALKYAAKSFNKLSPSEKIEAEALAATYLAKYL
ncbi:hypothetical protein A9Q84_14355 [Halobacteriovorax marinus]|uniref:Beta-lactamase n=1 Tax=Halobacteriovorax marinus TaxID=97084 RepID=A0A1Y5F4U1_9BACT|nr:hypothetical protein A9Q84_14355 [Halobacteriovorax marinus]